MTTFLFAGHDTTTNALVWPLYFLLEHPEILIKVKEEMNVNLTPGSSTPLGFTSEQIDSLKYLTAVIKESLRLVPSALIGGRIMNDNLALPWIGPDGKTECRHMLKAGDSVGAAIYITQNHPQNWDDPEKFDPDRFIDPYKKPYHPYCWVAFGNGRRKCIGEKLAMSEIRTTLCAVLQKFEIQLSPPDQQVKKKQDLTMRADPGLFIKVKLI